MEWNSGTVEWNSGMGNYDNDPVPHQTYSSVHAAQLEQSQKGDREE